MVSASQRQIEVSTAKDVAGPNAVPISGPGLAGLEVQRLAAEGYFQAIAYWLNEPLVPQNVYAQVLTDPAPGCIKVLIEFERAPQPKRLLKFVCDRIYKLNSNVIEGIYLVARTIGSAKTDWEQRVRIPTLRQRNTVQNLQTPEPEISEPITSGRRIVHESSRSKIARAVVRSQFQFFRAALITGSATAAFLFGGLTELVLSERLSDPVATESLPVLAPWYGDDTEPTATEVTYRPGEHSAGDRTVEAALETVAVVPHHDVADPTDPTITLLFGGELGLNDFIFEEAESLDRLFSDLSIYQQADVAMVGLSEPLATPSTSLQENFYHRTRPQAVKTLKAGGIDIVNLASEGTLTYGSRGLEETLKTLDRQGIYRVGAGRDQTEAHRPEILEVKGQRIAYLGYNPEAVKAAKENKAGVALTNSKERSHIVEDIRAIRPQVDWVVVNYRWGDILGQTEAKHGISKASADASSNFVAVPEDWQKSLAHDAVDAGADLVVGYHPSQIQGAEIYRDRAIAYSLGDFVFGAAPLADHDTAALRVSLRNQQMKVEFLPVTIRESKLQMATGEQGTAILKGIRNASKTFEQPLRFPAVLKATPTHSPAEYSEPFIGPYSEDPPVEEAGSDVKPLENQELDSQGLDSQDLESTYEAPAPHPTLREPEALFPVEPQPENAEDNPQSAQPAGIEHYPEPLLGPLSAL